MADELDLDLDELDQDIDNRNKVEERIKTLSSKVKTTSEERDELVKAKDELATANETLTKERDFLSSFTDPNAMQHKDAIWGKVKAGYSVEDATLVIMNAQPKEEAAPAEKVATQSPAGGSAATIPTGGGPKELADMTQEEKMDALLEIERRG